jgi:hypothetical protein
MKIGSNISKEYPPMGLPTHVTCPASVKVSYLTPGKTYEITGWFDEPDGFRINDDMGETLCCRLERCAHLSNHRRVDWILGAGAAPLPLDEALGLLQQAGERLRDMLEGDDGEAWNEARKFLPHVVEFLAKHKGEQA